MQLEQACSESSSFPMKSTLSFSFFFLLLFFCRFSVVFSTPCSHSQVMMGTAVRILRTGVDQVCGWRRQCGTAKGSVDEIVGRQFNALGILFPLCRISSTLFRLSAPRRIRSKMAG